MDVVTPLKISLFANLVNLILDPVLMFSANMSTLAYYLLCDLYAVCYTYVYTNVYCICNTVRVERYHTEYCIFNKTNMYITGIAGAALATCISEITSSIMYVYLLFKRELLNIKTVFQIPSLTSIMPLLRAGAIVQLRAIALNITFLAITRVTQALDINGVSAAAHAITIQLWQLTGIL